MTTVPWFHPRPSPTRAYIPINTRSVVLVDLIPSPSRPNCPNYPNQVPIGLRLQPVGDPTTCKIKPNLDLYHVYFNHDSLLLKLFYSLH